MNYIAAELIYFLFKAGESLTEPTARLYIYRGVCLQRFYNETYCDNLNEFPVSENIVQTISAEYLLYYKIILSLPAVFLSFCCGAWSDKVGRKIPAILTTIATTVAVLFYVVSTVNTTTTVRLMFYLVFAGTFVRGCFGKSAVMTMTLTSYISDISTPETRTERLGRLISMSYFGCFVGSLLVGVLLEMTSFRVVFSCVILVNVVCIICTVFFLKDKDTASSVDISTGSVGIKAGDQTLLNLQETTTAACGVQSIRESLQVLVKSRPNHGRTYLIVFFGICFLQTCFKSGESDVTLLLVQKSPISWNESMYGYMLAADYACLGIASAIFLKLLLRYVPSVSDVSLIIIGLIFRALRILILAFSDRTWMIYLSVVVGCLSSFITTGTKALISRLVGEEELGKTFSLLLCVESLSTLAGSSAFTFLYVKTFRIFPGFTFCVEAAVCVVVIFMLILITRNLRNSTEKDGKCAEELDTSFLTLLSSLESESGGEDNREASYGSTDATNFCINENIKVKD